MTYIAVALRELVLSRSGGCCEYCHLSRDFEEYTFEIEHIIAESHDGLTIEDNLALSCPTCNSFKGVNIAGADPLTGEATFLFHPRRQRWDDHFTLDGARIVPLTAEGRTTEFVLRLNKPDRVRERHLLIQLGLYPCIPP